MATLPWFKFYAQDYLNEKKLKGVDADHRSCFITSLCFAQQDEGRIDTRYITSDVIKIEAGVPMGGDRWESVSDFYDWLTGREMGQMNGHYFVYKNWHLRQESQLSGAERSKRYRDGKRDGHVTNVTLDKSRVDKSRKESPKWFETFNKENPEYVAFLKELSEKDYLSPTKIHQILQEEMIPYYREKGSALKERWEKERSFDEYLRARTWVKKHHEYRKDIRCSAAGSWHVKGESCYHQKPEPDYKRLPNSGLGTDVAARMRVKEV